MLTPKSAELRVQRNCLRKRLVPDRIPSLDRRAPDGSRFEKDHGIIPFHFGLERCAGGGKVISFAFRPISGAVHGASIAEQSATWEKAGLHILKVPLDVEHGRLRETTGISIPRTRESALKEDRRRFRNDHHRLPDFTPKQICRRRFPAAGAAGERDPVAIRASACRFY